VIDGINKLDADIAVWKIKGERSFRAAQLEFAGGALTEKLETVGTRQCLTAQAKQHVAFLQSCLIGACRVDHAADSDLESQALAVGVEWFTVSAPAVGIVAPHQPGVT
jgi:hypothetical protein